VDILEPVDIRKDRQVDILVLVDILPSVVVGSRPLVVLRIRQVGSRTYLGTLQRTFTTTITFRLVVSIAASIQAEIEDKLFTRSYPAAEYSTNISRVKLAHII